MKPPLTIQNLLKEAMLFCQTTSIIPALFGVTDGKAVGTIIEQKFKNQLLQNFDFQVGNTAIGIDLPGLEIMTDIKVTSVKQPQSSCPFKDGTQKIFGLGYNLTCVYLRQKR